MKLTTEQKAQVFDALCADLAPANDGETARIEEIEVPWAGFDGNVAEPTRIVVDTGGGRTKVCHHLDNFTPYKVAKGLVQALKLTGRLPRDFPSTN